MKFRIKDDFGENYEVEEIRDDEFETEEEIHDDETMGLRSNVKAVFDDIDDEPERICPYCGIVLEDDEKQCLNCGAIVH